MSICNECNSKKITPVLKTHSATHKSSLNFRFTSLGQLKLPWNSLYQSILALLCIGRQWNTKISQFPSPSCLSPSIPLLHTTYTCPYPHSLMHFLPPILNVSFSLGAEEYLLIELMYFLNICLPVYLLSLFQQLFTIPTAGAVAAPWLLFEKSLFQCPCMAGSTSCRGQEHPRND